MSWAHPGVLWGLILPAATLLAFRRNRGEKAWPGLARVGVVGSRVVPVRGGAHRRPWLLIGSLAFALLALAGPRWGALERKAAEPAREVLIALDLSRSMLVEDVRPSRFERAHAVVNGLLDGLQGERVGLIVFAGVSFVQVPLSSDYQIVREFLPVLRPGYLPKGGSNYTGMLRAAYDGFGEDSEADRTLFVVSDGESTTEGWPAELDRLRQRGVKVVALGVGTAGGGDVPAVEEEGKSPGRSRLEPATLQAIAARTGGLYRDVSEELDVAMLLADTVELGRRSRRVDHKVAHEAEQFQWFLAPALILGLLGVWREIGVQPRVRTIARSVGPARAASLAVMVLVAFSSTAAVVAHEEGDAFEVGATATDKLQWLVHHLAWHSAVDAKDLRMMAELTINYAIETLARGEPVAEGAIEDAVAAVNFGERLAPGYADWSRLRQELTHFLMRRAEPDTRERPPEQMKEALDEEDRAPQTNGQGSQQTTSESTGKGGLAKTDAALGELRKEAPTRLAGAKPRPSRVRSGSGEPEGAAVKVATDPMRALLLKRYREVVAGDSPGLLHQALQGDVGAEAEGGRDW